MYTQMLIQETYTNPTLCNSDVESNRSSIKNLDLYVNGTEETKQFVDEYIELDKTVGAFYYGNANIHKFSNPEKTAQILQIVFDDETFNSKATDEALDTEHYDFLRTIIWVELLGVNQEIWFSSSENEIQAFATFDEASAGLAAIKLSVESAELPT